MKRNRLGVERVAEYLVRHNNRGVRIAVANHMHRELDLRTLAVRRDLDHARRLNPRGIDLIEVEIDSSPVARLRERIVVFISTESRHVEWELFRGQFVGIGWGMGAESVGRVRADLNDTLITNFRVIDPLRRASRSLVRVPARFPRMCPKNVV